MYPKKRLGQHFLKDKNVIRKIIAAAEIKSGENVLEIGPGDGALTSSLIEAGARVTAIEIDEGLYGLLKEKFSGVENIEIIHADALKISFKELAQRHFPAQTFAALQAYKAESGAGLAQERTAKFKVISNLPYNISGPIIAKFLEEREHFTTLILMLQKEVAIRITAPPSTKDYGILSVLSRAYADVRRVFDVSPHAFYPKPKVTSSVVSFRILDCPRVRGDIENLFKQVVKSAFGKRRKTLRNALCGLNVEGKDMERAFKTSGIDPMRRGETLSIDEFIILTERLRSVLNK